MQHMQDTTYAKLEHLHIEINEHIDLDMLNAKLYQKSYMACDIGVKLS